MTSYSQAVEKISAMKGKNLLPLGPNNTVYWVQGSHDEHIFFLFRVQSISDIICSILYNIDNY